MEDIRVLTAEQRQQLIDFSCLFNPYWVNDEWIIIIPADFEAGDEYGWLYDLPKK